MSSTRLYPIRFIKSMEKGKSRPLLFELSDGREYVVKFNRGTRSLVNEFVVGSLAKLLSLPIIPFEIVCIDEAFLQEHPLELPYTLRPGCQFASLYLPSCIGWRKDLEKDCILNKNELAGIVVLDHWVSNSDRSRHNILVQTISEDQNYVYMIDHEKCFPNGLRWTKIDLQQIPHKVLTKIVHKWCASMVDDGQEFYQYVEKIHNLPEQKLVEIIQSIPPEWNITIYEQEALLRHLINGRNSLNMLLDQFMDAVGLGSKNTERDVL